MKTSSRQSKPSWKNKGVGVSQACEIICRRQGQWKGRKKENLEAAYYRFCENLSNRVKMLEMEIEKQEALLEAERQKPRHREPTLNNLFGTLPDYEK